ncbi:MAG: GAF domain-containing protein, partial [Actinomycetota bacterium]|nr:GAF domain-containing protein [Actinomycetota bacterium]
MLRGSQSKSEARLQERTAELTEANTELERQIAERSRIEEALRKNNAVVQLLLGTATASNEALSFEEAMRRCFELIRTHIGWPTGHAYTVSEDSTRELLSTDIWYVDNPEQFSAFRDVTEDTHFVPEVGLPGLVLDSGKPVWISDMSNEPDLPRFEQAVVAGVKAGFAFPVLVQSEVVAVVEFFTTEVLEPDEQLLETLLRVGAQLGRVIERERAREKHNLLNQELESRNIELDQNNKEIEAFVYSV